MQPGKNNILYGLILAGGQSKRMGMDKGLIRDKEKTWAMNSFDLIREFCEKSYISINKSQAAGYKKIFPAENLVIDSVKVSGPLTGIISAFKENQGKDFFVLATDLQQMAHDTLNNIYETYRGTQGRHEFYCYKLENLIEPLCAIYTSAGLRRIYQDVLNLNLPSFKPADILAKGNSAYLQVTPVIKRHLANFNSRTDLARIS